ncbi:MAG TPA: DUF1778 domain-containing protein [Oscillatoriaceae cyanobacterium M33_DOE_052]|uniref:DUF1778 domain-containing protein n=1 Tax=Planktothricoides sp. SpSt-374 TaxID=2282167 RepID=A0A7C3VPH1_9CYAN|nr:DUF1778 domain-containing protein [Oscillatoriaceae cyanobacterium M33_DOE_052]
MSKPPDRQATSIDLRVTPEEKELLEKAASLRGVSVRDYTLSHVLAVARQDVDFQERLVLSDRDALRAHGAERLRDLFLAVMENPPELQGKLKSAIQHYREQSQI